MDNLTSVEIISCLAVSGLIVLMMSLFKKYNELRIYAIVFNGFMEGIKIIKRADGKENQIDILTLRNGLRKSGADYLTKNGVKPNSIMLDNLIAKALLQSGLVEG